MNSFATFTSFLKLNIQDFSDKLQKASDQMKSFADSINGKTVKGMQELNKQTFKWGLNLKSVARVVSGIIISQAFYGVVQSVRAATSAVWEFAQQIEYAQIAYSNLFGDTALAAEFINVLEDFAAKTPFSFTEAEKSAKRLIAYGVEYKNVMYVMQGVMAAASAQGDPAKVEQITRAIGQISTYGKLMTAEVRQLTEAGIPVYDILQEKLGLTQDQLRNLGNEAIPASVAINALIDGMNERFGNVVEASSRTLTGIISNIKDNAVMLGAGAIEPLVVFVKSGLSALGEFLFKLREVYETSGIGGVFEALFPEEMHATIRQFVANLGAVHLAAIRLVMALGGLLKPVLQALINMYNALAPVLSVIFNVMAALVSMITNNATAMKYLAAAIGMAATMWVLYKAKAIAAAVVSKVITLMSKALAGLSTMLTFVVAHPFWALMIGLGAVLVGLSSGFGQLSEKISNMFKKLTQFNSIDPDKVLLPSQKERANDLDKFNEKLDGTSDAMDDLADSTGKATKAAKGLLSFDEVFKLNEPDEGTDKGIDADLGDLGDLGLGLDTDAYIPEVPDFSDYMSALKSGFIDKFKEVWNSIKDEIPGIVSTAVGAGFGKLAGTLLGGPLGGVLGTIVGGIVGYFWGQLAEYFGLTPSEQLKAGIIGGVGAGLGAIFGGILGGPLGAKLGLVIGGLVGSFWGLLAEHFNIQPTQHLSTAISGALHGALQGGLSFFGSLAKGLIPTYIDDAFAGFARTAGFSIKNALGGALKQGILGAIVGLGTGILSNAITGWIAEELNLTEEDLANAGVGQTIGNITGTITGFILGGPMGSLIGGALGQLAGSIVGEFWNYLGTTLKGGIIGGAAGLPIGALVGTLVGAIGGPLGAALGAGIGTALGALVGVIVEHWGSIKEFFSEIGKTISDGVGNVVDAFKDMGKAISDWFKNTKKFVGDIVGVMTDVLDGLVTFITDIIDGVSKVFSDIYEAVTTVWNDISEAVTTVLNDISEAVNTVWTDIGDAIDTVCEDVWGVVDEIWNLVRDLVIKVFEDIWGSLKEWFSPIAGEIASTCQSAYNTIATNFSNMASTAGQYLNKIWTNVSSYFTSIYDTIKTKFTNAYNEVVNTLNKMLSSAKQYFGDMYSNISSKVSDMYGKVRDKFSDMYGTVRDYASDIYDSISSFFSDAYRDLSGSISDMYTSVRDGIRNIYNTFTGWISDMWNNVFGKFFGWIEDGIDKLREFFGLEARAKESEYTDSSSSSSSSSYGHATGGIFNREHVARFAEGNKAEAIIPLENDTAMQPFVDAVANGLTASLAPILANVNVGSSMQPLYVGTLIADDRSLKELERRMEVIRLQESRR